MPRELLLHLGPSVRTGAVIRHGLFDARSSLAAAGVEIPDAGDYDQRWALELLRGAREARAVDLSSSWADLMRGVHASTAEQVIITDSGLAGLSPPVRARVLTGTAPLPVRLIVSADELASAAPDAWREDVLSGSARAWDEWCAEVRRQPSAPSEHSFWRSRRLGKLMNLWTNRLGGRLLSRHLVTVPRSGDVDALVWARFCEAAGIDVAIAPWRGRTDSLPGLAATSLIAQVNSEADRRLLDAESRSRVLRRGVVERILPRLRVADPAPRVTEPWRSELAAESSAIVERLMRLDVSWHGEAEDLEVPAEVPVPVAAAEKESATPIDMAAGVLAEMVVPDDVTASWLTVAHPTPPRVSVIVPVYEVQDYVRACLDSLLRQSERSLQIIVVDDGSTDGSSAIVKRYADHHDQVTLIRTDNQGLGAARNAGLELATGKYLAFLDSDDLAYPYAYRMMADVLDNTGSAMAVAPFTRLVDGERSSRTAPWHARVHERTRLGVHVSEFPHMIRNVFAWTKLFRREFWDAAKLSWPEGVRYEDQPCTIKALPI